MLILTRKVDQGIVIGDGIVIKVIGIEGNKVKLGVDAPKSITILREEIVEAVKQENRTAVNLDIDIDFSLIKPPGGEE